MLRRIIFLSIIAVLLFSCSRPVVNVMRIGEQGVPEEKEGIFYALPRNVIQVDVVVNKTEQIRGPYAEFAEKYLGITNVIKNNSTVYEISELKLSSTSEPDPQQYYFAEVAKNKWNKMPGLRMMLDEKGVFIGTISDKKENETRKANFVYDEESNIYPDIFKTYTDLNLYEKVDTIVEKVNADSGTVEKVILKRSMVIKSPEQKAKEAADFIIKIKENRFNLLIGFQEVNYDKETFRYMNEELENLEAEYRKLFSGISFTRKISYTYFYLPQADKPIDSVPLFRFSKLKGVLDFDYAYGEPVLLQISKCGNTSMIKNKDANNTEVKSSPKGFYYRIPDDAEVVLYKSDVSKVKGKFQVAQYGVITFLPAAISHFELYPETGSLKSVGGK